jgi:hypothetical protein
LLLASRDAFLAAARLFKAKNYSGAAEAFRRLCAKNPSDQVSRVYLGRCEKAMAGAGTQPIVVSLDSSIGTCT